MDEGNGDGEATLFTSSVHIHCNHVRGLVLQGCLGHVLDKLPQEQLVCLRNWAQFSGEGVRGRMASLHRLLHEHAEGPVQRGKLRHMKDSKVVLGGWNIVEVILEEVAVEVTELFEKRQVRLQHVRVAQRTLKEYPLCLGEVNESERYRGEEVGDEDVQDSNRITGLSFVPPS